MSAHVLGRDSRLGIGFEVMVGMPRSALLHVRSA